MVEIRVKIPDELKELAMSKKINWQLVIARKINEELERIARAKQNVSKSKLTEEKADELSDEINLSLARRYERLSKS
ncbi:hypothetical protein HYT24_00195 [Candidatus Pacearchaeota archaeon]|nr:hypothetical protein [Candidatus Pacearchaeota archaeon]